MRFDWFAAVYVLIGLAWLGLFLKGSGLWDEFRTLRLRCKVFGCVLDNYSSECIRCGTRLYDGEVLRENSWCGPLYALIHKYKHSRWKRHHKCEVCGRSMYLTSQNCCSEKCYDEWIPF